MALSDPDSADVVVDPQPVPVAAVPAGAARAEESVIAAGDAAHVPTSPSWCSTAAVRFQDHTSKPGRSPNITSMQSFGKPFFPSKQIRPFRKITRWPSWMLSRYQFEPTEAGTRNAMRAPLADSASHLRAHGVMLQNGGLSQSRPGILCQSCASESACSS